MMLTEPLAEPTLIDVEPVPTAVVRFRQVTMDQLVPLFDGGFRVIAASGIDLAGPAFAVYHGSPAREFDLELGYPVSVALPAPINGEITIEPSQRPAGRMLACTYIGGYEGLRAAWDHMFAVARERNLSTGTFYEVYVSEPGPDVDPRTLRTDLLLSV